MPVFYRVLVFLVVVTPSNLQAQTFSKIVITGSAAADGRESRLQILPNGDLKARAVLTTELLSVAYDVPDNPSPRLSSRLELTSERFDIEAKVPVSLRLDLEDIAKQKQTIQQLIRSLLSDRFGLVVKVRTERMPVYALSVVTGRTNLNRSAVASKECIWDTGQEGCHNFAPGFGHPLDGRAVDMDDLGAYLENWTDLPVVNRTALVGLFEMHSQGWKPMKLPPPPPGVEASGHEFDRLSPLAGVLADFGLTLTQEQQSVSLYTVERIHPPTAN